VNDTDEFEVVAQGASGSDAVYIARQLLPDIMLLDANMPAGGIEAARQISKCCPSVKTVMLTSLEGTEHMAAAREAGASFCLTKGISADELLGTLLSVHSEPAGPA